MPTNHGFRQAIPEDASALAALSIAVWLNTYASDGVSKAYGDHVMTTFSEAAFLVAIDDPNTRIVVCHREDFILGYVKILLTAAPPLPDCGTAEVVTICVRGHHKGMGIGSALLNKARVVGRDHGHDTLFLTVNHANKPAIAFYESKGMIRCGEWVYRFQNIAVTNYVYIFKTTSP